MNFKEELKDRVDHIEAILKEYLPKEEGWQKTVIAAMIRSFASIIRLFQNILCSILKIRSWM